MSTRKITTIAVLVAISIILVLAIHFPIFPAVSFLEYDPADIPILLCSFAFGPGAGITATAMACIIQGLTVSASGGLYGIIMHFVATGAYVLVSSLIYHKKKTKKTALLGIIFGTLTMAFVMIPCNLLITPYFTMGAVNRETVSTVVFLLPWIILFNLAKAGINGAITFLIYKKISPILHKG